MSNYIRPHIPGATVFFTLALAQRGSDLLVTKVEALRHAVRVTKAERPFRIEAWVVLPDHMHFVWTLPENDADFSTRIGAIKARFSMGLEARNQRTSHILRREKGIWQRRFYEHHIRNAAEYQAYVRYCWINPVKHGLVQRPEDWPFTSYNRTKHGDAFAPP